jgi:hypothetical protein
METLCRSLAYHIRSTIRTHRQERRTMASEARTVFGHELSMEHEEPIDDRLLGISRGRARPWTISVSHPFLSCTLYETCMRSVFELPMGKEAYPASELRPVRWHTKHFHRKSQLWRACPCRKMFCLACAALYLVWWWVDLN